MDDNNNNFKNNGDNAPYSNGFSDNSNPNGYNQNGANQQDGYNGYNPYNQNRYNGGYNQYGNQNGGYPGYGNGFQQYYNFNPEYLLRRNSEKRNLWRLSLMTGCAILSFILIQNIIVLLLQPLGLYNLYLSNDMFQCGVDIFLSIVGILLPFAFFGNMMKKISGIDEALSLQAPEGKLNSFLGVIAGLGACMVANYVTAIGVSMFDFSGVELTSPEMDLPDGAFGIFLSIVRVAVVAAVVEELSLRGFVMQNLRKYGDTFAIVMTALVFALMHGNLVQSPFALIAGIALGYFSVKTNSLWTGIIIHCFNNLFSTVISYLSEYFNVTVVNTVYYIIFVGLIVGGGICFWLFSKRTKSQPLRPNETLLSTGQRFWTFISSPTMIISILYIGFVTTKFIKFS